ncbi:MAG: TOBE domain-containing protein, partial [Candidatus Limnocylindrales bacterium]
VYERPVDMWVARLTGPAWSVSIRVLEQRDSHAVIEVAGSTQVVAFSSASRLTVGEAEAIVRPDWVRLGGDISARVDQVAFRGTHTDYRVSTAAGSLGLRVIGPPRVDRGATVGCTLDRVWVPVP